MIYIVKKGDTLNKIASRFSTSARKIATDNHIANYDKINVGMPLRINGSSLAAKNMSFSVNNPYALTSGEEFVPTSAARVPLQVPPSDEFNAATMLVDDYSTSAQRRAQMQAQGQPTGDFMPYILIGGGVLVLMMLMKNTGGQSVTRARRK